MRLLAVPRAAVRLAQAPHRAHEAVELGVRRGRSRTGGGLGVHAVCGLGHGGSFDARFFSPEILLRPAFAQRGEVFASPLSVCIKRQREYRMMLDILQ